MVLRDLDQPSGGSSTNSPSTNNDAPVKIGPIPYYDPQILPHPIPIPFSGFSAEALRFSAQRALLRTQFQAGRDLSREEAQALALHTYSAEQERSYITFGGLVAGIYRWYSTMEENKYPMMKKSNVNPNKFMFMKGPLVPYVRHGWRLALYMWIGQSIGDVLGALRSTASVPAAVKKDSRLTQLSEDVKAHVQSGEGKLTVMHDLAIAAEIRRRMGKVGSGTNSAGWGGDDSSPTGSSSEAWPSSSSDGSWSQHAHSPDSMPDPRSLPPKSASSQSPQAWGRSTFSSQQSDDDASPTGGLFQAETENPASAPDTSGSAWDRIRRGGTVPPIQPPPRPGRPPYRAQREQSTIGDSFTFAGSDEERQRGQEQAQREFDERLERERQGKDFSDENRRW
ncbi:unnamed protein product [Periconia digitata]|uniref:Uncharacterized protein n=1 Tax=Periconia digitata TaxID=1303443 RepID=A0A9W4U2A6_9PLEO|nr:unnamed protein product [Periconia digitata]